MNDYRDPYTEAREAVRKFRRTLPACIRRTVRFIGYSVLIPGDKVTAYFEDENGRHRIIIS